MKKTTKQHLVKSLLIRRRFFSVSEYSIHRLNPSWNRSQAFKNRYWVLVLLKLLSFAKLRINYLLITSQQCRYRTAFPLNLLLCVRHYKIKFINLIRSYIFKELSCYTFSIKVVPVELNSRTAILVLGSPFKIRPSHPSPVENYKQ